MTEAATLLALADRAEAVTRSSPDDNLSKDIAKAIGTFELVSGRFPSYPNYARSRDAAMTLIPSNLYWMMAKGRNKPAEPLYAIQIIDPETRATVAISEHEILECCIIAASLRAIAAQAPAVAAGDGGGAT